MTTNHAAVSLVVVLVVCLFMVVSLEMLVLHHYEYVKTIFMCPVCVLYLNTSINLQTEKEEADKLRLDV